MANNGYKISVYLDDNPNSATYMETYEERTEDTVKCPISEDDLVLISNECEISITGYTGYRVLIYYNRTTKEYLEVREEDPECIESSTDEIWVDSGSPYCETTEQGVNTGYMLQRQVQTNPNVSTYGEIRYQRWKSPLCEDNSCPIWDEVSRQCHIEVFNCNATFDGTADVVQIDINPLSSTYNQTRQVNIESTATCENCSETTFEWVSVGDLCGDDTLLCNNGIKEVSTNLYTVRRKYKTVGSNVIPMDEYQVVLVEEESEDCGFIKPKYRWDVVTGEYICDYQTYTKYEKKIKMVSYDNGVTWSVKQPIEEDRGDVIAYDSYDCGKPLYRWVETEGVICEDNGDDGKFIHWDSEGVMDKVYPCNESPILTYAEYQATSSITSTVTSPDGYENTYQVGDCVNEIADGGLSGLNDKLWLGDYTEKIGNKALCGYGRQSLDIPSRVNDISRAPFGYTTWDNKKQCWYTECDHHVHVLVMHPTTPPLLTYEYHLPFYITLTPASGSTASLGNRHNGSAIFVPSESYELYCNTEVWSNHVNSIRGRLLPMNNDSSSHKAILDYESDFTSWKYYMLDGDDETTITEEEVCGYPCMKKIKISDKVKTLGVGAFRAIDYATYDKLEEIDLGNGVETIGDSAFDALYYPHTYGTLGSITSMVIPDSVKTIGKNAFRVKSGVMTGLTLGNSVETIDDGAFLNYEVKNIIIPDSVKTIGSSAFANEEALSYKTHIIEITIGSGVTSIGDEAFFSQAINSSMVSLSRVYIRALVPPSISSQNTSTRNLFSMSRFVTDFGYIPYGSYTIYVPCETYLDYLETNWNFFNRGNCQLRPYGCSGEKTTIAVLHQSNGTDVNIQKPSEYFRKRLDTDDITPYSSTTTSIRVLTSCTEFNVNRLTNFSSACTITFDSAAPPKMTGVKETTKFLKDGQKIYVPCEGYDVYYYYFYDNLSHWGQSINSCLLRIDNSCTVQYQWVKYSDYCNISVGKLIDRERKYVIIDGESYPTVYTRTVTSSTVCFNIANKNGNISIGTSSMSYGDSSYTPATLNFTYMVEGGVDVTLSVTNSGKPYYYTYVDVEVYDGDTLVARKSGSGPATGAHLESFKEYRLVFTRIRGQTSGGSVHDGSATITFNNI